MASRFWILGTGNWGDTAHWSATSGGTGGASLPTSADNVYFDANSFTAIGQIVTINVNANCLDMDWSGALYSPAMYNSGAKDQYIYGSLTLISNMVLSGGYNGYFRFSATTTGKTITTAGKTCKMMYFNGVGGGWTLQDDLTVESFIYHLQGTLNTNGKAISTYIFNCNGTATRVLILGTSVINCSYNVTFTSTGLTMTANTSKILLMGDNTTFAGGGVVFNNVEFQGTPTTITGSNTFNQLKVDAGKIAKLTTGTTQTVTNLSIDGATIQSATAGSAATITTPNDDIVVRTATIQDITATKPIYALKSSVNVSGNTNITFTDKVFRGNVGAVKCTTTGRPTTNLLIGMQYYDTTLNKPIWYKGSSVWVDATGTTV